MSLDFSLKTPEGEVLFSRNITHNLTKMADAAGIYKVLWRPIENDYKVAGHCILTLREGLLELVCNQTKYEAYNSPNGWGMYEHFVPFVTAVLQACCTYPYADIDSNV
jgi:hypothetical protein